MKFKELTGRRYTRISSAYFLKFHNDGPYESSEARAGGIGRENRMVEGDPTRLSIFPTQNRSDFFHIALLSQFTTS